MTTVSVRGVSKSFGSLAVLRSLDLEVADASLTAILGPSGSGKTTLLRIIAGFERADGGTVAIGDDTVDDGPHYVPPEHRGIGYVPQEGALFPHLTVLGNIGFGVRRRRRRGSEAGRLSELLDLVGLHGLERRYPHQLSGGQQQRVALARALAIEPKLVLLDEPFASLDAALRATVRADVARILRAAGATALLVTHDQEEALAMADHIAILRRGQITPTAAPQEFYAYPLDPDMAAFVGEANLLPGTIDGTHAITVLGALPLRGAPPATNGTGPTPATVLVRPEQVEIGAADERGGIAGRVVATDYHGHDVLVTIQPDHHDAEQRVTARVEGTRTFPLGDAVTVRAHGSVMAWPTTNA